MLRKWKQMQVSEKKCCLRIKILNLGFTTRITQLIVIRIVQSLTFLRGTLILFLIIDWSSSPPSLSSSQRYPKSSNIYRSLYDIINGFWLRYNINTSPYEPISSWDKVFQRFMKQLVHLPVNALVRYVSPITTDLFPGDVHKHHNSPSGVASWNKSSLSLGYE